MDPSMDCDTPKMCFRPKMLSCFITVALTRTKTVVSCCSLLRCDLQKFRTSASRQTRDPVLWQVSRLSTFIS